MYQRILQSRVFWKQDTTNKFCSICTFSCTNFILLYKIYGIANFFQFRYQPVFMGRSNISKYIFKISILHWNFIYYILLPEKDANTPNQPPFIITSVYKIYDSCLFLLPVPSFHNSNLFSKDRDKMNENTENDILHSPIQPPRLEIDEINCFFIKHSPSQE